MAHEYIHGLEQCIIKKPTTTCEEMLCTEIRAYRNAQYPHLTDQRAKQRVKIKVRDSMLQSMKMMKGKGLPCGKTDAQVTKFINDNFEKYWKTCRNLW